MSPRLIINSTLPVAAAIAGFMAVSGPAQAISRIETTETDCSAIRSALINEGAAILRYTSKRGLPIYDRYVSSSLMCQSPSVGVWASVPARDTNSCRVIACDANASDDDDLTRFRPLLRLTP
ncbi:hypothetical protein PZ897_02885 [Hoeflea sp. YIM 152468]|uniref:hypothetical protein n=1 Tax=Hoeflea sp. YIM 152468 TaxID=3031759 RepID=UPI0023D9DFD7|nr:hypothetical protein [Hoeflea sp. YIM 152468]MDF1607114.1 hypothetical protein [Hoeflea sp. YIM 152468]